MKLHPSLFSLLLLITMIIITTVHSLSSDGISLLSLRSAVDDSPSSAAVFSDWNADDPDPCRWSGISCDDTTRVVGVSVASRNLRGYIPSELGSLTYLRRLNLHGNRFYGSIPDELFNATSLHSIFLHRNNLSGEIPRNLRECKQLQRLILSTNWFSGEIPAGIWSQMKNLVQLDLSSNNLIGPIPKDFGELQSLSGTLNLSFNKLSGEIPKSIGNLPEAVSFDLRWNNLSGEIPQTGSFADQGPTAFLGNPYLCGFPLNRECTHHSPPNPNRAPPMAETSARKGLSLGFIILISIADAIVVMILGLGIIYLYWKKKDHNNGCCSCTGTMKLGGNNNNNNNNKKSELCGCLGFPKNESELGEIGEGELVAIDKGFKCELDELLRASAYVLGRSRVGIVYKVVLGNGLPVAVRRLGEGGKEKYKEFETEIQGIGKVKHPNVVKLRAYYWAPEEKLIISDFISNGNLANALRGKTGPPPTRLTWSTRLKIAKGIARGLAYLHECSPKKLVHGDIKPSNILLDNEFQPYISDFGLNRLITITGNNPSSSSSGFIGGALPYVKSSSLNQEKSNNYRAPEARIPSSRPTQKWDVYSFGVMLLELLTGKSPEDSTPTTSTSTEVYELVRWVRKGFEEEKEVWEMVDPMLLTEVHAKKEVMAVFHLALACTEGDPEVRPRMKTVSENLERIGT